ncbi:hypothetical protein HK102_000789 [Quaeritorhiza haematococci]|nr:hypothetical protein HK102_000789 [Quaeritorhiza haematococci]
MFSRSSFTTVLRRGNNGSATSQAHSYCSRCATINPSCIHTQPPHNQYHAVRNSVGGYRQRPPRFHPRLSPSSSGTSAATASLRSAVGRTTWVGPQTQRRSSPSSSTVPPSPPPSAHPDLKHHQPFINAFNPHSRYRGAKADDAQSSSSSSSSSRWSTPHPFIPLNPATQIFAATAGTFSAHLLLNSVCDEEYGKFGGLSRRTWDGVEDLLWNVGWGEKRRVLGERAQANVAGNTEKSMQRTMESMGERAGSERRLSLTLFSLPVQQSHHRSVVLKDSVQHVLPPSVAVAGKPVVKRLRWMEGGELKAEGMYTENMSTSSADALSEASTVVASSCSNSICKSSEDYSTSGSSDATRVCRGDSLPTEDVVKVLPESEIVQEKQRVSSPTSRKQDISSQQHRDTSHIPPTAKLPVEIQLSLLMADLENSLDMYEAKAVHIRGLHYLRSSPKLSSRHSTQSRSTIPPPPPREKPLDVFRYAADLTGSIAACYNAARCSHHSESVFRLPSESVQSVPESDFTSTLEMYRDAAGRGHLAAQYNLGVLLYLGALRQPLLAGSQEWGVGGEESVYWLRKAAVEGYDPARVVLALVHLLDENLQLRADDMVNAFVAECLERAGGGDMGFPMGYPALPNDTLDLLRALAEMHFCIGESSTRATHFVVSDTGSSGADGRELVVLAKCLKAAKRGSPLAAYNAAVMYEKRGDVREAIRWFQIATQSRDVGIARGEYRGNVRSERHSYRPITRTVLTISLLAMGIFVGYFICSLCYIAIVVKILSHAFLLRRYKANRGSSSKFLATRSYVAGTSKSWFIVKILSHAFLRRRYKANRGSSSRFLATRSYFAGTKQIVVHR